MSNVVLSFMAKDASADKCITNMTIDDAEHYTPQKRASVYAWYRDKFKIGYKPEMAAWLAGYQRFHGRVNTKN